MRRQGRDREGVSALRVRLASGASEAASRWEIGLGNRTGFDAFCIISFSLSNR